MAEEKQNNELSFRAYFAQAYLMIIGIIQGAVFAYFSNYTYGYIETDLGGASNLFIALFDRNLVIADDPTLYFIVATFVVIIIVTWEYIFFLAHFRRVIRLQEMAPPFLLGFAQFWMASSLSHPANWWASAMLFSLAGFIAYINLMTYRLKEIFEGDDKKITRTRTMLFHRTLCTIISFSYVWVLWKVTIAGKISPAGQSATVLIYALGFGVVFWITGSNFSRKSDPDYQPAARRRFQLFRQTDG